MTQRAWFCELHRTWTTGDCLRCDDDLIATHNTDED